jgi:8-oxo-dGTP diphosphatase
MFYASAEADSNFSILVLMKTIEVVAAIIIHEGKILCVQRGPAKYDYISGKWEFPGGKVEEGETKKAAIVREIKEELHMDITVDTFFTTVQHSYSDFHLTMHSFLCSCATKELTLTEHTDFKWLSKHELTALDWAGADVPIVEKLVD